MSGQIFTKLTRLVKCIYSREAVRMVTRNCQVFLVFFQYLMNPLTFGVQCLRWSSYLPSTENRLRRDLQPLQEESIEFPARAK